MNYVFISQQQLGFGTLNNSNSAEPQRNFQSELFESTRNYHLINFKGASGRYFQEWEWEGEAVAGGGSAGKQTGEMNSASMADGGRATNEGDVCCQIGKCR